MSEPIINPDAIMCDTLPMAVSDLFKQLRADGVVTGSPKNSADVTEAVTQWSLRLRNGYVDPAEVRAFAAYLQTAVPTRWPACQAFFDWKKTGKPATSRPSPSVYCVEFETRNRVMTFRTFVTQKDPAEWLRGASELLGRHAEDSPRALQSWITAQIEAIGLNASEARRLAMIAVNLGSAEVPR